MVGASVALDAVDIVATVVISVVDAAAVDGKVVVWPTRTFFRMDRVGLKRKVFAIPRTPMYL